MEFECFACGKVLHRNDLELVCNNLVCRECNIKHAQLCISDKVLEKLERKRMKAQDDEFERRSTILIFMKAYNDKSTV